MKPSVYLFLFLLCMAVSGYDYELVKDGKPAAVIVTGKNPVKSVLFAAAELNAHIKLITGTELPVRETAVGEGVRIHLGETSAAGEPGLVQAPFKELEHAVLFRKDRIYLAGKDRADFSPFRYTRKVPEGTVYDWRTWPNMYDERGTLNAVYDFLETHLGIRWFDQTEFGTDFTPAASLRVHSAPDKRAIPAFEDIQPYSLGHRTVSLWHEKSKGFAEWEKAAYPDLCVRFPDFSRRHNLGYQPLFLLFGFRHRIGGRLFGVNHSLYSYYDRFLKTHPEFFAKGYPDAKRPPQLCYSNPALIQQVAEDAKQWFSGYDAAKGKKLDKTRSDIDFSHYAVCPMDNSSYCKCDLCKGKIIQKTAPFFANGNASGYIWTFINNVAEKCKKELPGKRIGAIAYAAYAQRPEFPVLDNIDVRVCMHIREVYDRPRMENDEKNLRDWSRDRGTYAWVYFGPHTWRENGKGWKESSYHVFPAFFAHSLSRSLKLYHSLGVKGIFMEGFGYNVEAYAGFELLKNPERDADEILKEYFTRMYGPAGPALERFYNKVEKVYSDPDNFIRNGNVEQIYWGFRGSRKNMESFRMEIEEAEKAIANASEVQKKRFENFKLSTWNYMLEGKKKAEKTSFNWTVSAVCPLSSIPCGGDVSKVDWSDAQEFYQFNGETGEGTRRKVVLSLKHDGRYLYLRFREKGLAGAPSPEDGLVFFFSPDMKQPMRKFFISRGGKNGKESFRDGEWELLSAISFEALGVVNRKQNARFNAVRTDAGKLDEPGINFKRGCVLSFEEKLPGKQTPGEAGLIGDWDFGGNGTEIHDRSPRKNHGRAVNMPQRVEGPFGAALRMERTMLGPQYVEIEKAAGFRNLKEFTVLAWVKLKEIFPGERLAYPCILGGDGELIAFAVVPNYANVKFRNPNDAGKPHYSWGADRFVGYGKWQQVGMVYDGKLFRTFVNGRISAGAARSRGQEGLVWDNEGKRLLIGQHPEGNVSYSFRGELGSVKVYARALSPEEIFAGYAEEAKKVSGFEQGK